MNNIDVNVRLTGAIAQKAASYIKESPVEAVQDATDDLVSVL